MVSKSHMNLKLASLNTTQYNASLKPEMVSNRRFTLVVKSASTKHSRACFPCNLCDLVNVIILSLSSVQYQSYSNSNATPTFSNTSEPSACCNNKTKLHIE